MKREMIVRRLLILAPAMIAAGVMIVGLSDIVQEHSMETESIFRVSLFGWHTWSAHSTDGRMPLGIRLLPWAVIVGGIITGLLIGVCLSKVCLRKRGQNDAS